MTIVAYTIAAIAAVVFGYGLDAVLTDGGSTAAEVMTLSIGVVAALSAAIGSKLYGRGGLLRQDTARWSWIKEGFVVVLVTHGFFGVLLILGAIAGSAETLSVTVSRTLSTFQEMFFVSGISLIFLPITLLFGLTAAYWSSRRDLQSDA